MSVRLSRFYINLNISFIKKNIFSKFAGNDFDCENLSVQNFGLILKKQNGRHNQLFENYKGTLNLEIFQLAHQICTKDIWHRNASLLVILA